MNIHELPMDWDDFTEAWLALELDINITAGDVDQLADDIVAGAAVRGEVIKRADVIRHLKHRFAETKIKHDVLDIQSQVEIIPMGRDEYDYMTVLRRNVRRFLRRRGRDATRKYLEDLCETHPRYRHVFAKVLGEMP